MSLKRENLVAVAVLSVNLEKEKNQGERETNSWLEEKGDDILQSRIQRQFRAESFDATSPTASSPTGSFKYRNHKSSLPSPQSPGGVSKFPEMSLCGTCGRDESCNCANLNQSPTSRKFVGIRGISVVDSKKSSNTSSQSAFKEMGRVVQTVRVDDNDMNPLKPCGKYC